jgi:nitroreductase / dihydropteridine reductase
MDFRDVVKNRYANRSYTERRVPEETIAELLDLMRYTCSALNLQPWRVKVVGDQEARDRLYEATWGEIQVKTCSHVLVLCADTDYPALIEKYERAMVAEGVDDAKRTHLVKAATEESEAMTAEQKLLWSQKQVYILLGNAVNGACALGLASCPMEAFYPDQVAQVLGLPAHLVPTVLVAVGYPAQHGSVWWRYTVDEILI